MAPLVWLVTGATSGIGAALANEIVARGDKVIASGRKVEEKLAHLKSDSLALLEFDVAGPRDTIEAKTKEAWNIFGHVDVLFNNAGFSGAKAAEEADDEFMSKLFDVNLFGPIRTTQAILPLFRSRGQGILAFTSSSSAWGPLPFLGHYGASKAAISAWVESLHSELRGTGIKCLSVEPGGFVTSLGQPRAGEEEEIGKAPAIAAYQPLFQEFLGSFMANFDKVLSGDLKKCSARIVDIVKQEGLAAGKPWTVRIALGSDGLMYAHNKCKNHLDSVETWRELSASTDSDGVNSAVGYQLMSKYLAE